MFHVQTTKPSRAVFYRNLLQISDRQLVTETLPLQRQGTAINDYVITHRSLIHSTIPQFLPKPVLQTAGSSASSFNLQHPPVYLRPYSSCLRILPRLFITSILPSFLQQHLLESSSYARQDQSI